MSSEPKPVGVKDALDNLVNQFADPMSFFRELVQNSLDAGSPEVEIYFDFKEEKGQAKGVMTVHVDDFGEGMDRQIIDSKLTRLFSSSKEGDLTKIGRFGIGFVSVFAIGPDAVCVDTSRGGENWRVLFKRDRSFVRIAREDPVDGTKIRIIKAVTKKEFAEFVQRARQVVTYWCKHVPNEILFDGEPINQQLDIDTPIKVRHEEQDTEIVVGYARDGKGFHGFYNKGLTLHEGHEETMKGISFKVNSRYLEHTLTRDNVLRDENFEKAMEMVTDLAKVELPEHLFDTVEEAVKADRADDMDFHYRVLDQLASAEGLEKRMSGRVFFKTVSGKEVTVKELRRAHRKHKLYCEEDETELTAELEKEGYTVIRTAPRTKAYDSLSRVASQRGFRAPDWAGRVFARPLSAAAGEEAESLNALHRALTRLLDLHGARISEVAFGRFHYPHSCIRELVAITQKEIGEVTHLEDVHDVGMSIFSRRRALVVNTDEPTVKRLIQLSETEPELAAYFLMKLFYLRGELSVELDGGLANDAHKLREFRMAADSRREGRHA